MKKLIIDCDNTFGVSGCDIDDGLAITYTLASGKCDVIGITTTFGNNTTDVVYSSTVKFMDYIGITGISVSKGHEYSPEYNSAAKFLSETAAKYPKELSVLAIGSLTNLYHAYLLDNSFYDNIDEIAIMGGITEPLTIGGKILNELNLSCSAGASYNVLTKGRQVKIATGNNCLDAFFTKERFELMGLTCGENHFLKKLCADGQYWFKREREMFGHDGIYKWDVYAAAMLLNPEMFNDCVTEITPDMDSLKTGRLFGVGEKISVNLPKIKDSRQYIEHVYDTYEKFIVGDRLNE